MHRYAIALGSNRRHGRHGAPRAILTAVLAELARHDVAVVACSRVFTTAALGPAGRGFANAAAVIASDRAPDALLALLKAIERGFGRRKGRRWGARVLDLDILLWSGGAWHGRALTVPHPDLARRRFVLDPLVEIARDWRLPSGNMVAHARSRLTRPKPIP